MENLFDDLLPFIFRYLNIQEIYNCRLVSKNWYHLINRLKFNELIIRQKPSDYIFKEDIVSQITGIQLTNQLI